MDRASAEFRQNPLTKSRCKALNVWSEVSPAIRALHKFLIHIGCIGARTALYFTGTKVSSIATSNSILELGFVLSYLETEQFMMYTFQ